MSGKPTGWRRLAWLVASTTAALGSACVRAVDGRGEAERGETGATSHWPAPLADLARRARSRFAVPTLTPTGPGSLPSGATVLDVRTRAEVSVSAIPGARSLPDEATRSAFLEADHSADGPFLVVCTAGWRSAEFTRRLVDHGIDATNLEGGVCAFALVGGTLVDPAGEPVHRIHAYSDDFADCVPAGYEAVTEPKPEDS